MIRIIAKVDGADFIEKLRAIGEDKSFDQPVDTAAWKIQRKLVEITPTGWTSMTRKRWNVTKPTEGVRVIFNDSKVMLFLEAGTGQNTGGYVYPKTAKALYIPLTQAASYGWNAGLSPGIDYILRKRVKGIQPLNMVRDFRPQAEAILKEEMVKFLERKLNT
jgi:hypothetical protein